MRYLAPADVSGIDLTCGPCPVVDGFVAVPDDLSAGDLAGLNVNGFTLAPPAEVKPEPSKPADKDA